MKIKHLVHLAQYHLHNAKHAILHPRSVHWPVMRRHWLKDHGICANPLCKATTHLQVHHKRPYHLFPGLELLPSNFITLCMTERECHLKLGHNGNWQKYNARIDQEIAALEENARDLKEIAHAQR